MTHLYPVHDVIVGSVAGLEPSHEFGEVRGGGRGEDGTAWSGLGRVPETQASAEQRHKVCVK